MKAVLILRALALKAGRDARAPRGANALQLELSGLYDRLAVERDGRAGEAYEVAVGGLVVAARPQVFADADGDRARGNSRRDGAVRGQLDVRVDVEVHD